MGDEILVISYGQRGTLVKQLKDGRWEAQVGLIKMTLEEKEFNLIKAEKKKRLNLRNVRWMSSNVQTRADPSASGPPWKTLWRGYARARWLYRSGPAQQHGPSRYHPRDRDGCHPWRVTKVPPPQQTRQSFEYAPKMQVEVARLLLRLKDKSSPSFSLARFRLKKKLS